MNSINNSERLSTKESKDKLLNNKRLNSYNKNKLNKNLSRHNSKGKYVDKASDFLLNASEYHKKAKHFYEIYSKEYDIDKNLNKLSEYKWIKKMIDKGTFEDKINAIANHIRSNPNKCLSYLDNLTSYLNNKNHRNSLYCINVLKELYTKSILDNKKYKSFVDNLQLHKNNNNNNNKDIKLNLKNDNKTNNINEISKDVLISIYIEDFIHRKYYEFISFLEEKTKLDVVSSIKTSALTTLQELLKAKPEREEYILDLLIYKLGDPKHEISSHAISLLRNLQEIHTNMSYVLLNRINNFIYNTNLSTENGVYHSLVLISQFKFIKNEQFVKYGLSMFFNLFNEYVEYNEERYYKFQEKIIKVLSSYFKTSLVMKDSSNVETFNDYIKEKITHLFKLSHSPSIKLRIQVLKLIFSICKDLMNKSDFNTNNKKSKISNDNINANNNNQLLIDRYYRSLYELIIHRDVMSCKNLKEFLKLVVSSCIFDNNSTRCLAILKRLLQSASLSEPPYICCVLIILSHVLYKKNFLWKYIDNLKLKTTYEQEQQNLENVNNEISKSTKLFNSLNKREPKFIVENSLIELSTFVNHYHPTVQKWSKHIINDFKTAPIEYDGDPLLDFSLVNFLHKFITKNPKVKNLKKKINKEEVKNDSEIKDNENKNEKLNFIEKFTEVKDNKDLMLSKKHKEKIKDIDEYADKIVEDEISRIQESKYNDDIDNQLEELSLDKDNEDNEDDEDYEDYDSHNESKEDI